MTNIPLQRKPRFQKMNKLALCLLLLGKSMMVPSPTGSSSTYSMRREENSQREMAVSADALMSELELESDGVFGPADASLVDIFPSLVERNAANDKKNDDKPDASSSIIESKSKTVDTPEVATNAQNQTSNSTNVASSSLESKKESESPAAKAEGDDKIVMKKPAAKATGDDSLQATLKKQVTAAEAQDNTEQTAKIDTQAKKAVEDSSVIITYDGKIKTLLKNDAKVDANDKARITDEVKCVVDSAKVLGQDSAVRRDTEVAAAKDVAGGASKETATKAADDANAISNNKEALDKLVTIIKGCEASIRTALDAVKTSTSKADLSSVNCKGHLPCEGAADAAAAAATPGATKDDDKSGHVVMIIIVFVGVLCLLAVGVALSRRRAAA